MHMINYGMYLKYLTLRELKKVISRLTRTVFRSGPLQSASVRSGPLRSAPDINLSM